MLRTLHWTLLRSLPVPLLGSFATLVFLLLMQFLIRHLPELVGRGLPLSVLFELIAYSLAYMVTLAVPMSVLIATLAAFGKLAESRAYLVVRSSGISLMQVAWPVLIVGLLMTSGMTYFNNVLLPEANFRMGGLWRDIRDKKPGFQLEAGTFFNELKGYSIFVEEAPAESNDLYGVRVFDHSGGSTERRTIAADSATLASRNERLELTLFAGEIHQMRVQRESVGPGRVEAVERYERLQFDRHRMTLDLTDLSFERRERADSDRSDRTMRTSQMIAVVDSLERGLDQRTIELRDKVANDLAETEREPIPRLSLPDPLASDTLASDTLGALHPALTGLSPDDAIRSYETALQRIRVLRSEADRTMNAVTWEAQRANRYRVEIYKKLTIAMACVVFVLVGIPLGLAMPRVGVGVVGTLAVFLFLFYWVTLNQGEKLADRGLLPPWGMWSATVLVGLAGVLLFWRETQDPAHRNPIQALASLLPQRKK
ncbi:MAG: LptF/LptG family permease [Bacteroidota bacterium]